MASIFSISVSIFMCFIGPSALLGVIEASNVGFSINLIHRDSPLSPLYNPNNTHFDRLRNAFYRSISRTNRFKPNSSFSEKSLESDVVPGGGEYFMRISIGTPPVEVLAIADTGSDLIWVQCLPCDICYEQKYPIFDPRRSSTYHSVFCGSRFCNALDSDVRTCAKHLKTCGYTYSYGDHSFTNGDIATEKFTIGSNTTSPVHISQVVFGCGTRNGGTFDELGSGIIGLGGGSLSLISQLGSKISDKFSYCLVPQTSEESNITSKIQFGNESMIFGSNVVSTPLVSKVPDTYYYLTLEAISVGNKRLSYIDESLKIYNMEKGNIIIDSGTTLTLLDSKFFNKFESALEESVHAERVSDPKGLFSICFKDARDIDLPVMTAHFTNADVKLQPMNTFVELEEYLLCSIMIPSNDIAIFGNLAQMDFVVGYDLEKRTVSFKPTDCTKH